MSDCRSSERRTMGSLLNSQDEMSCHVKSTPPLMAVEQYFWTTKQIILEKIGQKNESLTTSSDVALDAKIDYLKTIPGSLTALTKIMANYRRSYKLLTKREKKLGQFMDESGKGDKSSAGKALRVTGQFLFFISESRKSVENPIERLSHSIEAFANKAVVDTFQTLKELAQSRKVFLGSLMWLKSVAEDLDHKNIKTLLRFQIVQKIMKNNKARFDCHRLKTLQKIDLLSLSRCNMFSTNMEMYVECLSKSCKEVVYLSEFAGNVVQNITSDQSLSLTLQKLLGLSVHDSKGKRKTPQRVEDFFETAEGSRHDLINFHGNSMFSAGGEGLNLCVAGKEDFDCSLQDIPVPQKSLESNYRVDMLFGLQEVEVPAGTDGKEMDDGSCFSSFLSSVAVDRQSGQENSSRWLDLLDKFDPLKPERQLENCDAC